MPWSRVVLLAAALGALGVRSAHAQDQDERGENSGWITRPSAEDEARFRELTAKFPAGGRVAVRCALGEDGALSGCRVIRESPQGGGIGELYRSSVEKLRRKPPGPRDAREFIMVSDWFPLDTPADWARRPTTDQLRAVYPTEALRKGIGGRATINCIATVQGALQDCVAVSESPVGSGFGGAAVALAPQFTMKPAKLKGVAAPSVVRIPIRWGETSGGLPGVGSKKVAPPGLLWADAPSFADVVAAYPRKAREAKVGGRATLACDMSREGRLTACQLVIAQPTGYGFDLAAKALAKRFLLDVKSDADRKATRSLTVHLPITFDPSILDGELVIGKPSWAALPTIDQLRAALEKVEAEGTARATISCAVQPGGTVGECKVLSEEPGAKGVGQAALSLAPNFRLTTWTAEGLPTVGGIVRIPIRFEPGAIATPK